jgi:hypothetical protein
VGVQRTPDARDTRSALAGEPSRPDVSLDLKPWQGSMTMTDLPIVFIHIAKTAGTSLLAMLREHIPVEASVDMTGTDPNSRSQFVSEAAAGRIAGRNMGDIRLIHGHIPYWVCISLACRPVTLLRNPAELLASFYYYSKNVLSKSEAFKQSDFVKESIELSLEDFVAVRDRNSISKSFCNDGSNHSAYSIAIAKKNLESMVFGISEEFNISSELIFRELDLPATSPIRTNMTPFKPELTGEQRSFIETHSPDDCELYEWAVAEFHKRYRAKNIVL